MHHPNAPDPSGTPAGVPRLADADFARLVESIQDYAIFMLDPEGVILSWNRGAERIKGYTRAQIVGSHFSRFYPDDDVRAGKPAWELAEAARVGRFEDEGYRLRGDGSRFWANVVITAVRDDDGGLRGFAKITRDLTERRLREQRLLDAQVALAQAEANERRLTALQSIADVTLGTLDLPALLDELLIRIRALLAADTATILLLDPAAGDLTVTASLGMEPEVAARVRVPLGVGIAGRVAATRTPMVVPDLAAAEVVSPILKYGISSVAAVPLLAGDHLIGVLHVGTRARRDFTPEEVFLLRLVADRAAAAVERARTHAALAESERRSRATFEQAAVGIAHVRPDGRWLRVNKKLCNIVGYTEEEMLRGTFQELTHPDDLAADLDHLAQLISGELDTYVKEKRYIHRAGHVVWIHITVSLVRDGEGRPDYAIAVIEDISPRKRAEEERDRLLVERSEALSARDRFLSVASHELRTPLTTLMLQTQSLERLSMSGDPNLMPRLAARLGSMARQVDRLAALVDQLLDVTRIHEGRLRLQIERVDLCELTREVAARFEDEAAQAACAIDLSACHPTMGHWDRLRLDQVLTNLVSNAIKYGRGRPVAVNVSGDGARARVAVTDHGIGIRAEDQPRIFERFERLVSEKTFAGLGLGLWITREIVVALGGSIDVTSSPGQGSTFVVDLPIRCGAS